MSRWQPSLGLLRYSESNQVSAWMKGISERQDHTESRSHQHCGSSSVATSLWCPRSPSGELGGLGSELWGSSGELSLAGPSGRALVPLGWDGGAGRGSVPSFWGSEYQGRGGDPNQEFPRVQGREEGAEFRWSRDGEESLAAESSADALL